MQSEVSSSAIENVIPAPSSGVVNLIPPPPLSGASLLSVNTEVLDWRDVNSCELMALGKEYNDDKFYDHIFGDLYCENLIPFRNSKTKLRMLEIGFGCGHHNHGRSAQGKRIYRVSFVQPHLMKSINFYYAQYGRDTSQRTMVQELHCTK